MPDEDAEIRRRIRAAMAIAGLESWEALAAATGYSRTTLKDLGTDRKQAKRRHLIAIAAACDVPIEWFTVSSIPAAVARSAAITSTEPLRVDLDAALREEERLRREERDDDDQGQRREQRG